MLRAILLEIAAVASISTLLLMVSSLSSLS